jgi:DNA sulfur modification protein DndC
MKVLTALEQFVRALEENSTAKWIIGFSGGKDSTALLKLLFAALRVARSVPTDISVIYCDTGVENPILDRYVKHLFGRLRTEVESLGTPLRLAILRAPVTERYFVKVIGRGYPTPTHAFRWCTKNLRIKPVAQYIQQAATDDAVVALGVRHSESTERSRTYRASEHWAFQEEGGRRYRLFLPLIDLEVSDVWDVVFMFGRPSAIRPAELQSLYRDASGECPIIKAPQAAPCGSGRFGCWTCTVVRKDHSALKLVEAGHDELRPYLEFRNWLARLRDEPERRWWQRRNGVELPGPFTLKTRQEILERLHKLSGVVGEALIDEEESKEIARLWQLDEIDDVQYSDHARTPRRCRVS